MRAPQGISQSRKKSAQICCLRKFRVEVTQMIALQLKEQSDDFRDQLAQLQKSLHALNVDVLEMQKVNPQAKLSGRSGHEKDYLSNHVDIATRVAEQDEKMQALKTGFARLITVVEGTMHSMGPHDPLDGDHMEHSQQHEKYSNAVVAVSARLDYVDTSALLEARMVKVEERMEVMEGAVRDHSTGIQDVKTAGTGITDSPTGLTSYGRNADVTNDDMPQVRGASEYKGRQKSLRQASCFTCAGL